jgi:DDE superfamily endonuclease
VIGRELHDPAILAENVYNMDETGVLLSFLASRKYMIYKDDWRKCREAAVKRTLVTAVECISADGRCLSPLIIWPATTHRSDWTTYLTPGWHYACSPSGFANTTIVLDWYQRVFDPQTKQRANHQLRILINDGFGPHKSLEVMQFCYENNIILCRLPSYTSHKL